MGIREEADHEGTEEAGKERMELELGNLPMQKLSEAIGRPREDQIWDELKGKNQQTISISVDARNSHLLWAKLEAERDTRWLA